MKKIISKLNNKQWFVLEKEDYANYLFVTPNWEAFSTGAITWRFPRLSATAAEYINSSCNLLVLKEEYDQINKIYFSKLFSKPKDWHFLHKINKLNSNKVFKLGKKIKRLNPLKLSNKQLIKIVMVFNKAQVTVHLPRGPMWLLETPDNLVSNYLQKYLEEQSEKIKAKIKPQQAYQYLISSFLKSNWTLEKEALAKIGIIKDKIKLKESLKEHVKKYEWLEYGLEGKILDFYYFNDELQKIKKIGVNKFLKKIQQEIKEIKQRQLKVIKEYKIDKQHQEIFKIVRDSLFVRLYSKDAQFFGFYCLEPIFKEIGRRFNLSLEQIRFLAPQDFPKLLEKDFSKITEARQKYSLHISEKGKTSFYLGQEAKNIIKQLDFYKPVVEISSNQELKGQPAYNGKVCGRVKIVNVAAEMIKIHSGNILVSRMTSPSIVPAMKQAAAIITDAGGITCHAAIVARELKKPCIIGTKLATSILRDGDMVEVDADKGIIRIIS